jgi:hypothetical protein
MFFQKPSLPLWGLALFFISASVTAQSNENGNLLVSDLFTENQHLNVGAGYASSLSDRIEVNGVYLELYYQFEVSEKFTLAPGGFVILGNADLDDTVSSSVVVLGIRGTLKI